MYRNEFFCALNSTLQFRLASGQALSLKATLKINMFFDQRIASPTVCSAVYTVSMCIWLWKVIWAEWETAAPLHLDRWVACACMWEEEEQTLQQNQNNIKFPYSRASVISVRFDCFWGTTMLAFVKILFWKKNIQIYKFESFHLNTYIISFFIYLVHENK